MEELLGMPAGAQWFVEPGDKHTKGVIEDLLGKDTLVIGTNKILKDIFGKGHKVLQVPDYHFIDDLYEKQKVQHLHFKPALLIKGKCLYFWSAAFAFFLARS